MDFNKQKARIDNLFANEKLENRFKLESYTTKLTAENTRSSNSIQMNNTMDFTKYKSRDNFTEQQEASLMESLPTEILEPNSI